MKPRAWSSSGRTSGGVPGVRVADPLRVPHDRAVAHFPDLDLSPGGQPEHGLHDPGVDVGEADVPVKQLPQVRARRGDFLRRSPAFHFHGGRSGTGGS